MSAGEHVSAGEFGWRGGAGRGLRRAALGAGPAAVVLLIALSASGAPVSGTTHTYTAPYKGAHISTRTIGTMNGCGGGGHPKRVYFNRTAGVGGFSENASAKWCGSSANNSANFQGVFTVAFPFHVKSSGAHNISVTWLTVATGSVNLTAGTCSASSSTYYAGCTRSAAAFVYGSAYLLDKTTGTKIKLSNHWPGNSTYVDNYTSCAYGKCNSVASKLSSSTLRTGAAYWAWYWNGTVLNASHNYTLKMSINGGVTVVLTTTGGATLSGASADGQLNSATLGNEEKLYAIAIQ
jgi:hypothetical protein